MNEDAARMSTVLPGGVDWLSVPLPLPERVIPILRDLKFQTPVGACLISAGVFFVKTCSGQSQNHR